MEGIKHLCGISACIASYLLHSMVVSGGGYIRKVTSSLPTAPAVAGEVKPVTTAAPSVKLEEPYAPTIVQKYQSVQE